ncbi:MAG: histidinol-phosphate transaminase [Smithellaceae bacterium]|nr:histidinol-phosphate transaminase [Smithellaceae bacterium]
MEFGRNSRQAMELKNIIRPEIISQRAYQAGDVACRVKLDANENPFPMPSELKRKFIRSLGKISLHRYPAAGSPALIRRLAASLGVESDMILVGNGSDELIQVLCTATGRPGAAVLIPAPTFVMYRISALNNGLNPLEVPLDEAFGLDLDAMRRQIRQQAPALTFLSYPNNPTGNCFPRASIERIIKESPGIVVVDEAYFHFSGKTFLPDLSRYENLVILRSLSKVGLAAMRIGLLVGPRSLICELNKVRLPYNLNAFSQAAAEFFVDHESDFITQTQEIMRLREELVRELATIRQVQAYPTEANFIFFRCTMDANRIYGGLLHRGVMVRNFHAPGILWNCLRVTVGSQEENLLFVDALRGVINELGA